MRTYYNGRHSAFVALPRTIKLREIDDVSYTCITQGVAEVHRVVPRGRIIRVIGYFTSFTAESFQSSLPRFVDVKRCELCCFHDIFVWWSHRTLSCTAYHGYIRRERSPHKSYVVKQRIICMCVCVCVIIFYFYFIQLLTLICVSFICAFITK